MEKPAGYQIKGQDLLVLKTFQLGNFPYDPDVTKLTHDAVGIMDSRYNHRLVNFNRSDLEKNGPIEVNLYQRYILASIVKELVPDARAINPPLLQTIGTRLDLEEICTKDEHLGLVFYSVKQPNGDIAINLMYQAKEKGIEIRSPMVFYDLETTIDGKSGELQFKFGDFSIAYPVPILSRGPSYVNSDDPGLVVRGFPNKQGEGLRTIKTASSGVRLLTATKSGNLDVTNSLLSESEGVITFLKGEIPEKLGLLSIGLESQGRKEKDPHDEKFWSTKFFEEARQYK